MPSVDVVRAWKDEQYRLGLTDAERALVPENPAGTMNVPELLADTVIGGHTETNLTTGCCNGFTNATCICTPLCSALCSVGCGYTYNTSFCGCASTVCGCGPCG